MAIDGNDIVDFAQQYLGTPYVWGGNSLTQGVDCSGLTQQVFQHFGIEIPRVSYDQIGEGSPIKAGGLRPGDLVFFDTDPSDAGPDHVGIYAGNGMMIHAPRPGKNVEMANMTGGYYMDRFMGGRRLSGVHSTGSRDSDFDPGQPKLTPEELAASYGWAFGFLNSNDELKNLFAQAVDETWTAEKFQAELRDTEWWQTTSDTARQAEVMETTDPATWQASLEATMLQVRQIAAEIGAAIPSGKIRKIAEDIIRTGMEEDAIRYTLGEYVNFLRDGSLHGEAAEHEYVMREQAYNMGIRMSDQTVKNFAQRVIRGISTQQDYQDYINQQAISAFPSYEDQINGGMSMRDVAEPYIQMYATEMEVPDTSIDILDPSIKAALNGAGSDGKPTGMTLTEFQSRIRNTAQWRETSGARDTTMAVAGRVLEDFGLI